MNYQQGQYQYQPAQGYPQQGQQSSILPQQSSVLPPPQQSSVLPPQEQMQPASDPNASWLNQYSNYADVNSLRNYFDQVDLNRSGSIEMNELKQALANVGDSYSDQEVQLMLSMFDIDNSGQLNFDEFSSLVGYVNQTKAAFQNYSSGAQEINSDAAIAAMRSIHSPFIDEMGGDNFIREFDETQRGISLGTNFGTNFGTNMSIGSGHGGYNYRRFLFNNLLLGSMRNKFYHNRLPGYSYGGYGGSYGGYPTSSYGSGMGYKMGGLSSIFNMLLGPKTYGTYTSY